MKYILQHYKKEIALCELDFTVREKFLGQEENDDWWDHEKIRKFNGDFWWGEATEIDVDLAINTLQELKKEGCNFVEIMHHGDHHGYIFVGKEVRLATDTEIMEHELKNKEISDGQRQKKIAELEAKLKELKSE